MSEANDEALLVNWIFGYQISQAIAVAVRLGIADILEAEPKHYVQLSETTQSHAESLYRLMRALATLGIFQEIRAGVFSHTTRSRLLISKSQNSLHLTAMLYGDEQYCAWSGLMDSIRTGQDAFSKIYQKDFFSYLDSHPDFLKIFNDYVSSNTGKRIESILSSYDFSKIKKIVDIGGGYGCFLVGLLKKYPNIHGVVFDTGKVINAAIKLEQVNDLNNRIEFVAGDFLEAVPLGGDTYFLSNIIHGWNNEQALKILKNCRREIKHKGKLLIVERILTPGNEMDYGKWMDINMLVMHKGKERTLEEYTELLHAANFVLTDVFSTPAGVNIIESVPV